MMDANYTQISSYFEGIFTELSKLESLVEATICSCQNKEFSSSYYDLNSLEKVTLSNERNQYINLLNIALDEINNIKIINNSLENEITILEQNSYNCSR